MTVDGADLFTEELSLLNHTAEASLSEPAKPKISEKFIRYRFKRFHTIF